MRFCDISQISHNIYIVKFHEVIPVENDFNEYLKVLKSLYDTVKEPIVVIFDAQDSKFLPSELRVALAQWFKDNYALIQSKVIKSIYIAPNPIIEFLLESIFIMQKSPVPYDIVYSLESAMKESHLIASGSNL